MLHLGYMALFVNQNERRTQLQEKIAADLSERIKSRVPGGQGEVGTGMLEETKEANHHSLFWVGVVTVAVIILVIAVIVTFNGV